jgi:hypothetical protein
MLLTMRAQIAAMRALVYFTAGAIDRAKRHPSKAERTRQQALADLLIPVAKAWCTDTGCAVASTALQVHGGTGFIEETGAAQHYRDARITPIYEGTNGIQAIDLLGRKLARDDGKTVRAFLALTRQTIDALAASDDDSLRRIHAGLRSAASTLRQASRTLLETWQRDKARALAGASPYLTLFGVVAGGWLLAKGALAAQCRLAAGQGDAAWLAAQLTLARFYAENLLPQAAGLATMALAGSDSVLTMSEDQL